MIRILIPNYMKKQTFFIAALMALWATCLHAQELIPYRKGDKWGFCTPDKKVVVQPKYDDAEDFKEGLAQVKLNRKWGFIDKTGKEILPPKYDYAKYFQEGLAEVKLNGKYFYIKVFPDGKIIEYYDD
jgi:hypothetical protein